MSDINFGILQNTAPPITTQVVGNPNTGLEHQQLLAQGIQNAGANFRAAQESSRAAALQPGLLQQQQLTNQGLGLQNQKTQMDIQGVQYQMQQRADRQKAYQEAKAKGGTEAGLDAVQEKLYSSGDPTDIKAGMDMATNRQTLKEQIAKDNRTGVMAVTSAVVGTMQDATPDQKDPQTGQVIPGKKPLQLYTEQYPTIKKMYPNAPDPSTFRSEADYEDTFVHPVLDTAKDYVGQIKAEHDELVKQDLYKAQTNVKQKVQDLQSAIAKNGPNSQEAKDAAIQLQQAQTDAQRVANGNNYLANTLKGGYKSIMPESLGGDPSVDSTISTYKPDNQPQTKESQPSTKVIDGTTYIQQNGKWYTK